MSYLKKVFTKKQIVWLIVTGAVLILFFINLAIGIGLSKTQNVQISADRWDSKGEHAMLSVFFSDMAYATEDTMKELSFNIDEGLDKEAVSASNDHARRKVDGYSSTGKISVTSDTSTQEVKAYGVGGDYFLMHPLKMLSGSYFDGNDVMQDHIILDNDTAWLLYGSYNIVGKPVWIGDKLHIVSGVYERDKGRLNDLAGNNEATAYISYESLAAAMGGDAPINCYEVLMPNPVSGFAEKIVKDAIHFEENRFTIVQNTGRFHWTKLIKNVGAFGSRSMNGKSILYPYWENMARGLEDIITPFVVIGLLLFIFVVANIIVLLARMWKNREIHSSDVKNYLERRLEIYREKKREMKKPEGGEYL